jgi:hypothetical protein
MDNRLNKIALHHGLDEQLRQTMEECSELILAICKYNRQQTDMESIKQYNLNRICEEIVDVDIMIQQLKILIEHFDYDKFTNQQIKRELTRIGEGD